jgi:hypothetical protein
MSSIACDAILNARCHPARCYVILNGVKDLATQPPLQHPLARSFVTHFAPQDDTRSVVILNEVKDLASQSPLPDLLARSFVTEAGFARPNVSSGRQFWECHPNLNNVILNEVKDLASPPPCPDQLA